MITLNVIVVVDEKMRVPLIVIVGTSITNSTPVNVTTMLIGITIEQLPDGICPFSQILALLKSPDIIAVQTGVGVVVAVSSVPALPVAVVSPVPALPVAVVSPVPALPVAVV